MLGKIWLVDNCEIVATLSSSSSESSPQTETHVVDFLISWSNRLCCAWDPLLGCCCVEIIQQCYKG